MGLNSNLLSALKRINFNDPTDVQKEAIPVVLTGKDVVVRAKTGTGKTGAFLIPIMQMTKAEEFNSALVILPTRELALQVAHAAESIAESLGLRVATVYGGASMDVQIRSLRKGVNIIVGTPGRLIDLMRQGELTLQKIKFLVLDEADIMFDMGFIEDIQFLISKLPTSRQTMLFSATMPESVSALARDYMREPVRISVGREEEVTVTTIKHYYAIARGREKLSMLLAYIKQYKPEKTIVFVNTQRMADLIFELLKKEGFDVALMHGGLSQAKREYSLSGFRKSTQFLIATNVAARGLDIGGISDIINFDAPEEPAVYVHRVGRSARMGADGRAFTIFSHAERYLVDEIPSYAKVKMEHLDLDTGAYRYAEEFTIPRFARSRFGGAQSGHPKRRFGDQHHGGNRSGFGGGRGGGSRRHGGGHSGFRHGYGSAGR